MEKVVEGATRLLSIYPDDGKMLYSRGVAQMKLMNIPEALADFMSCRSSDPQQGIDASRLEGHINVCQVWLSNAATNDDDMMLNGDEGDDNSTSNGSVVSSSDGKDVFGINPSGGKLNYICSFSFLFVLI